MDYNRDTLGTAHVNSHMRDMGTHRSQFRHCSRRSRPCRHTVARCSRTGRWCRWTPSSGTAGKSAAQSWSSFRTLQPWRAPPLSVNTPVLLASRDIVTNYRIYSNKRHGTHSIFRDSGAALIRGRRLFKIQLISHKQVEEGQNNVVSD